LLPPERGLAITWVIFKKESIDLLRDRRAVFFALILPIFLYPILYYAVSSVQPGQGPAKLLRIGLRGPVEALRPYLEGERIAVEEIGDGREMVRSGALALFVDFEPAAREGEALQRVTVHHVAVSPSSQEALRRVRRCLEEYADALLKARFERMEVVVDPAGLVSAEASDLATEREVSLWRIGRFFPAILVILLISGGSFVAIDLVAGEKERRTLETLYVHPVPAWSIVWGKFLVLIVVSLLSVVLNVAGMFLALILGAALGFGFSVLAPSGLILPPLSVVAVVFLLLVPLTFLTSAALLAISARARSYREAQTYLLPLMLMALLAFALAARPEAKLTSVVALVPVANVLLAVREAFEGNLATGGFCLTLAASALYAWLALSWVARFLEREEVILGLEPPPLGRQAGAEGRARRGLFFGALMLLLLYFGGSLLQTRYGYAGLAGTLWGLVLLPALLYPLVVKAPFRETLALRRTRATNFLLALLAVPATAVLVSAYMTLQDQLLPMPQFMEELYSQFFKARELSPAWSLLLFAVSPAICEELLWRGAFQGELEPRGRRLATVLTVGLFFGAFHQSIYRLVPTAALGSILALVRDRSRSIYPCMLVHFGYNALLYAVFLRGGDPETSLLGRAGRSPWAILLAGIILAASLLGFRGPGDAPGPAPAAGVTGRWVNGRSCPPE
jgi:sodium transport system permease protein